jgi:uncharacterized membrane protein
VNRFRLAIAIVLLAVGLLWVGQGLNLLGGSTMSGQPFWAVVGVALVVVAAGVAWTARGRTS